jgi:hypothetical protein
MENGWVLPIFASFWGVELDALEILLNNQA